MSEQHEMPTEEKPYFAGPKVFKTAEEALEYAEKNHYTNAGFKFGFLSSWCGPRKQLKEQVRWFQTNKGKTA